MTSVRETLNAAADLLEPEGAWTQGYVARAKNGRLVEADARAARCWCGVGAVLRVSSIKPGDLEAPALLALHKEARKRGFPSFGQFNDAPTRTQAEVVQALRDAANAAGGPA